MSRPLARQDNGTEPIRAQESAATQQKFRKRIWPIGDVSGALKTAHCRPPLLNVF